LTDASQVPAPRCLCVLAATAPSGPRKLTGRFSFALTTGRPEIALGEMAGIGGGIADLAIARDIAGRGIGVGTIPLLTAAAAPIAISTATTHNTRIGLNIAGPPGRT
jgi:hypothetical protein